jgi:molybdenum cofactor cytidylyltransferase
LATEGGQATRLEAVVLGGGFGSRFGGRKLTTPWRGGRLIDGALATAFAAPVRSVTLVTGADPDVEAAARDFARRHGQLQRLRVVHAADHGVGMSATLRAGIASLPPDAAGAFVFLGDMPAVAPATLAPLVEALTTGARAAAPIHAGRRGHPVLFSASLFEALRRLSGDEGARAVLSGLGHDLALIACDDPGVLIDIDRPEDLGGAL